MYRHAATKPTHCYTIMYHKESVLSSCFPMCQFNTNAANCGGSHCRHGGTNNFQASWTWTVRTKCLKFEEEKMLCSMLPCLYRPGAWLFALTPDFEGGHCWTYQQQGSMCVTRITTHRSFKTRTLPLPRQPNFSKCSGSSWYLGLRYIKELRTWIHLKVSK